VPKAYYLSATNDPRRKGGIMRKMVITLIAATILSATAAAPAFADRWGGHDQDRGIPGGPLWPVVAALSIPAAVINTVTHIALPIPGIGYPATPATAGHAAYAGPANFAPTAHAGPADYAPAAYAGPPDYAPAPYHAPREYVAPRGYYTPRGYYREREYRSYRGGW
jgi:hypothetical protein